MKEMKKFSDKINEDAQLYDRNGVFIEPVASATDFSRFIDHYSDELGFSSNEFWDGMNFSTGHYSDMSGVGIIDPAKVTRCALQNAVSAASTLLTTSHAIIET